MAPPDGSSGTDEPRITLRGTDLPLANVLSQIARSARLAMVIDKEVKADSIIAAPSLENLSLASALAVILTPFGYSYSVDRQAGELRVFVYETRTFKVAVPTIVQKWSSSVSNAGESAGAAGGAGAQGGGAAAAAAAPAGGAGAAGGASGGGGLGAMVQLDTKTDTEGLWQEIEKSLKQLVGETGSSSVNRVAGFAVVRTLPSTMSAVAAYFDALNAEMGRVVLIDTKVLQVDLSDSRAAGIDWAVVGQRLASIGLTIGAEMPVLSISPANRGAVLSLSGDTGNAFIRALEEQGDLHLIAQPSLVLGNNLPAIINVGTVQTYVASQTTTINQTLSQTSVQTASISDGLVLSILPRLMEDGSVSLALAAVSQDILSIGRAPTGEDSFVDLPRTSRRAYSGVVRTRVGESLVIGGMIADREENKSSGLPFLARIPIIGFFFGAQEHKTQRTELVLTITVRPVSAALAGGVLEKVTK